MTYRYTFYKIPFSETGIEYPLPRNGGATESLAPYRTYEKTGSAAFRENQTELVFTDVEELAPIDVLLSSNYLRIGVVNNNGDISTDTNINFYWVRDLECLGGLVTPPVRVTIAPDDIMTEFFSSKDEQKPIVKGRIVRTSDDNFSQRGFPIRKFCSDDSITYEGGILQTNDILTDNTAIVIASLTLSTGSMLLVCYRNAHFISNPVSGGERYLYDIIQTMSNIYAYGGDQGTAYNVSITNITIVPSSWIPDSAFTNGTVKVAYTLPGGGSGTLNVYTFSYYETHVYEKKYYLEYNTTNKSNLCYIKTPCGFYKVGIPAYTMSFGIGVYISPGGIGTDNITILLILNNELTDITQDYSAAFAVNDKAVKKAQFKQVNAISQISNIIGAVGGVVGGVASGNYFGAVQSLAGGASGIAENAALGKAPAQTKSSGDASNTFENIKGLCVVYILSDSSTTDPTTDKYGLPVEITPYVEIEADTITESYYKFSECDVVNLSGGGQDAQATVETLFVRGVRFKSL